MKKVMVLVCFMVCAGILSAQSQLSSKDADKTDSHDRPIGGITIKLPSSAGDTPPKQLPTPEPPIFDPTPPSENEDIPPTEIPTTEPPPEDPPTYYGEPVSGKFVFLIDASGSMAGSRIATVRAETTSVISKLTEDDEFDCVAYGGQFSAANAYSKFMWGMLLSGAENNKNAAVSWVNGSATNPGSGTPTYACLKASCALYPSDLTKMFLLTDGSPNVSGSAIQILIDFPSWWTKFDDAEFIAICVGGDGPAQTFMQQLATLAGGTYIAA